MKRNCHNRFIYKINNHGTLIIVDAEESKIIRDMYRACDYLNEFEVVNHELKHEVELLGEFIKENDLYDDFTDWLGDRFHRNLKKEFEEFIKEKL